MSNQIVDIPVIDIVPGINDRTVFDSAGLKELAESIERHGLAQPITVRPLGKLFQIVAGERRFRAISQVLKRETAPCIVRPDMSDEEASAIMLAENIGRRDLDPVDEAFAYKKRIDEFGWSPSEISQKCGVSADRVRKRLRLTEIRPDILHLVRSGQFPLGHAETLSVLDSNRQMIASRPIIEGQNITARQFKAIVYELLSEQQSESLFDLALFSGEVPQENSVKVVKVSLPIARDLPPLTIPEEKHTGAIIYKYILDLQEGGFNREAETLGTVLYWLEKGNYAKIPTKLNSES